MVPLCTPYQQHCTKFYVQITGRSYATHRPGAAQPGGGAGQRTPWAVPNKHSNPHIPPQPPPAASSDRRQCGPACAPAALGGAARRRRRATAVARPARRPPGHPWPSPTAQPSAPPSPPGSTGARARAVAARSSGLRKQPGGRPTAATPATADPRRQPRRGLPLGVCSSSARV